MGIWSMAGLLQFENVYIMQKRLLQVALILVITRTPVRPRTPHSFLKFYRTPHYFRTSKKGKKDGKQHIFFQIDTTFSLKY